MSTMHAITSCITIVGAGRQSKSTSLNISHLDVADAITGLLDVQLPKDMPIAQSPVLENKEAVARSSASQEGGKLKRLALLAVIKKWKVRVAKKISKDKIPLVPGANAEYMKRLLHHSAYLVAFQEENEKARAELKALALEYYTAEEFDGIFPPSLQYISRGLAEEISDHIWEELVSRK